VKRVRTQGGLFSAKLKRHRTTSVPASGNVPPPFLHYPASAATGHRHRQVKGFVVQKSLPSNVLGPWSCSVGHGSRWCSKSHPGARVHYVPAFATLVISISQSEKHRCCLPLLGAAGGSGSCSVVSWDTLSPSPSSNRWCCIVCWLPHATPLLTLQTLYQCMPPASAETIACGPSERSQRSLKHAICTATTSHGLSFWVNASD